MDDKKQNLLLSPDQKEFFLKNGFLILPNFVSKDICQLLMNRANTLINHFEPRETPVIFSTEKVSHLKTQYFLDSADKISFFFEENAFAEDGTLKYEKSKSINKIGHALHDLDPVFDNFSRTHKIAALMEDLAIEDPLLVQSMYICKQPFIGGEVNCHQDNTYLYVEEQPVTGLWFALEDATLENGCLWAIPGGHKTALKSRLIRDHENQISMATYDETPWPLDKLIPLEVPQGSLIVLHGLLPHLSKANTSSRSRHAYTLHIVSNKYNYAKDNWLQRQPNAPFRGFL